MKYLLAVVLGMAGLMCGQLRSNHKPRVIDLSACASVSMKIDYQATLEIGTAYPRKNHGKTTNLA